MLEVPLPLVARRVNRKKGKRLPTREKVYTDDNFHVAQHQECSETRRDETGTKLVEETCQCTSLRRHIRPLRNRPDVYDALKSLIN